MGREEAQYFGREGIARTLLVGTMEGKSFLVSGGPFLGKTALLQQVYRNLIDKGPAFDKFPPIPVYLSLRDRPNWTLTSLSDSLCRLVERTRPKGLGFDHLILLLDDCEFFIDHPGQDLIKRLRGPLGLSYLCVPWSIVWAGNIEWYKKFLEEKSPIGEKVRLVPLAVFTEKEARSMLDGIIPSNRVSFSQQQVFDLTGKHPFLLHSIIETLCQTGKSSLDMILEKCSPQWEAWCQRCFDHLRQDIEKNTLVGILYFLIEKGGPVNPSMVGKKFDLENPKPFLDKLCILGLLERTLLNGEAIVWAGCGFFNQWFLRVVTQTRK